MKALLILFTFISTSVFSQELITCNDHSEALIGEWVPENGSTGKLEKMTFYPNGLITIQKEKTLQQQAYKLVREHDLFRVEIGPRFGPWTSFGYFYVGFSNPRQIIIKYQAKGKTFTYTFVKTKNIKSGIIPASQMKEDNYSI